MAFGDDVGLSGRNSSTLIRGDGVPAITVIRGVEVPGNVFWHGSRCFTVLFQRSTSFIETDEPMKRERGR
eukprot:8370018-Pyramimonas_sp.AAC.1